MTEQRSLTTTTTELERLAPEGYKSWPDYWTAQGMPWRTEPEIDEKQQGFLAERRAVKPDFEKGIYPFRDENGSIKLARADVEWLLATHESGGQVGPVQWEEEKDKGARELREGLDLRGVNLRGVDLRHLPLTCLRGGSVYFNLDLTSKQREAAKPHMEGSRLDEAHLELADLQGAYLERANLNEAHLEAANLSEARLNKAALNQTHLEGADLSLAHLKKALLIEAHLEEAKLNNAHLEGALLAGAHLEGADLRFAYFDTSTMLNDATLGDKDYGFVCVNSVHWGGANLADVRWRIPGQPLHKRPKWVMLGDEREAREAKDGDGSKKDAHSRLADFENAVQANRQVATVLRDQGLNNDADCFAYQAQVLQRQVLRREYLYGTALGSWLLDLVSGYGYRPARSLIAYIVIISAFAGAYLLNAQFAAPHLSWDEALVLSISAFHGRGFFTSGISLGDTLARLAAGEAIIGLLIEITFIATFTQRFFAR